MTVYRDIEKLKRVGPAKGGGWENLQPSKLFTQKNLFFQ